MRALQGNCILQDIELNPSCHNLFSCVKTNIRQYKQQLFVEYTCLNVITVILQHVYSLPPAAFLESIGHGCANQLQTNATVTMDVDTHECNGKLVVVTQILACDVMMKIYNNRLVISQIACDKVTSHKMTSEDTPNRLFILKH